MNTKMDEGPCPNIHSDVLKAAFEKSTDLYKYDSMLEREFINRINEVEKIIKVWFEYFLLVHCCSCSVVWITIPLCFWCSLLSAVAKESKMRE